jgi:hypothetical protein
LPQPIEPDAPPALVEALAARVEELQARLTTLETVFTGQPLYPDRKGL